MRDRYDVTVVVPTYQGERYVAACLESVASQDLDGVEVLVVDDCSTDRTLEVVDTFSTRLGSLRVVRNAERAGAVANLNRCVDLARGRWMKPVFQDDMLEPGGLSALRSARRRQVRAVVGARRYIYEGDVPDFRREACEHLIETSLCRRFGSGHLERSELARAVAEQTAGGYPQVNLVGEPVAVLLDRRAVQRAGGFDQGYVQLWDYELVLRLGMVRGLSLVDEPVATFRVHESSETARNFAEDAFRINVVDRLRIHVAYATAPSYQEVRRAATTLEPPADLVAVARGVVGAARTMARALPADHLESAMAQVDELSSTLPELSQAPSPSRSTADAREEALVEELRSGPWFGLSQTAVVLDAAEPDEAMHPPELEDVDVELDESPDVEVQQPHLESDSGGPAPIVARSRSGSLLAGPAHLRRIVGRAGRSLRTSQWWGHMVGPIVAFALLQIGWRQVPAGAAFGRLVAVVACALFLGAYGYVVNDASDVELDRRVGKSNSMARFSVPARLAIIGAFAVAGAVPWVFVQLDARAALVLAAVYLMPLLYSAHPVRLKERHVLGPLADASNAFVLPAMFTLALYAPLGEASGPDWLMIAGALLWSFSFGLRAILKHLIDDAWNDRSSGTVTLVVLIGERRGRWLLRNVLFPSELVGLGLLVATVFTWSWPTAVAGLVVAGAFHAMRVSGLIARFHSTTTLDNGWWMSWYHIWPSLLLSAGLAVGDLAHAGLVGFVVVVFWSRNATAVRNLMGGLRHELGRRRAASEV